MRVGQGQVEVSEALSLFLFRITLGGPVDQSLSLAPTAQCVESSVAATLSYALIDIVIQYARVSAHSFDRPALWLQLSSISKQSPHQGY